MIIFLFATHCHSAYSFPKNDDVPLIQNVHCNNWEPMRMTMDYTQLREDYIDEYKCTQDKTGQNITWGRFNYTGECTQDMVLTEEMTKATIETFENARKYLESMLKVKRFNAEAYLQPYPYNAGNIPNTSYSGVDMYVTVFPRVYPKGSQVIAQSYATARDSETLRPIQCIVIFNIAHIPSEPETFETKNQNFITTCIHEMLHTFGIDEPLIPYWHSHENNKPYGNKYLSEIEIGGYKRYIINSPYAHNFAVKQYGVETFKSGNQEVRSGIILEEIGGTGTAMSHPDQLYYISELMLGYQMSTPDIVFIKITEVTMALLMDTGYYKVDYTKGKPMWWGSKETNKGEYIKDFITGPPQLTFPPGYLADPRYDTETDYAGFDYSYIGKYYGRTKTDHLSEEVKNNLDWYNPLNYSIYGYEEYGFQRILIPQRGCENGTAAVNFEASNATCLIYKIDGGQIEFSSDTLGTVKCTKKDELVKGKDGKTVICPDPEDFAIRIALSQKNTFDSDPFEGAEKYFEKSGLEPWVIALIVIGCFVVLAVISVAIFCVTRHKKKDKSSEETP